MEDPLEAPPEAPGPSAEGSPDGTPKAEPEGQDMDQGADQDADQVSRTIEDLLRRNATLWERGLCVDCLGRQTARLGYGLTNRRRGEAILITLSMAREYLRDPPPWLAELDLPYLHLDEEQGGGASEGAAEADDRARNCPLCDGLFTQLDDLAEMITEALRPYEASSFKMGCMVDDHLVEAQAALVQELGSNITENLKQHLNRELSHRLAPLSGLEPDPEDPHLFILLDTRYDTVKVQAASLFIKGRYRKLVRNLPQTRWPCRDCQGLGCHRCEGTGYRYRSSVEQLVTGPFMEATNAVEEKFHGAGREDIDVRCLGTGRPFVIEFRQPRLRELDLEELTEAVNEGARDIVEVEGLEWCRRDEVAAIKQAQNDKTYRVKVAFEGSVDEESLKKALEMMASRVIQQQTPSRVAHRRAAKVRKRNLRSFSIVACEKGGCELELTCEHGTYVKELVHGDEDRTVPNLAALLETPCQVTALDVLAVHDEQ